MKPECKHMFMYSHTTEGMQPDTGETIRFYYRYCVLCARHIIVELFSVTYNRPIYTIKNLENDTS